MVPSCRCQAHSLRGRVFRQSYRGPYSVTLRRFIYIRFLFTTLAVVPYRSYSLQVLSVQLNSQALASNLCSLNSGGDLLECDVTSKVWRSMFPVTQTK